MLFMNRDGVKSSDKPAQLPVAFIQRRVQHAGWCIRQSQAQLACTTSRTMRHVSHLLLAII